MQRFHQVMLMCAYLACIATRVCDASRVAVAQPVDGEEEVVEFREGTTDDDVIAQLRERTPELFHTEDEVNRVNSEFTSRYFNPFEAFVRPPCCSTVYSIRIAPSVMTDIYGTQHQLLGSPFFRQYYQAGACRSTRPHETCRCCRQCGVTRRVEQFWVWQRTCRPDRICFQLKCFYVDDHCRCTRKNRPVRHVLESVPADVAQRD